MTEDWVHIIDAMELEKVDPQDVNRNDPQWTKLWDEHWNAVEDWWRSYFHMADVNTDPEPLRSLLKKLQDLVPKEPIKNGTESLVQHAHPNDVPAHIKGAAKILFQGELECVAEGDRFLPNAVDAWTSVCMDVRRKMNLLLKEDEVTEGEVTMSRHSHARAALDALDSVEWARNAFLLEESTGTEASFETDGLPQLSAELAHFAFSAGVHARLALGKRVEQWAVIGQKETSGIEKRREGAKQGARGTAKKAKEAREPILKAMRNRLENFPHESATKVGRYIFEECQIGASAESNRKIWSKYGNELSK